MTEAVISLLAQISIQLAGLLGVCQSSSTGALGRWGEGGFEALG